MPLDGKGGYELILADRYVNGSAIIVTVAQPLLWGTKNGSHDPPNPYGGTNCSYSGPIMYADFNGDGVIEPETECVNYHDPFCPGDLGPMVDFFYHANRNLCGDANCDGVVDAADIQGFFGGLSDPGAWAVDHPGCSISNLDINRDGNVDGADIQPFFDGPVSVGYCLP